MVGDTVWVNQSNGGIDQRSDFQAKIIQIILDGSLTNSIVIRKRTEVHDLAISSAIYDLKPSGDDEGSPRVSIDVPLIGDQTKLFETQKQMLDSQLDLLARAV